MADEHDDAAFAALIAARPEPPVRPAESPAATALVDRILAEAPSPRQSTRRHRLVIGTVAAAAVAVVVLVVSGGLASTVDVRSRTAGEIALPAADVRHIAAMSTATLNGTGRAAVDFTIDSGLPTENAGTVRLAFAGDDIDMVMRFEGREGRPGFEAANRTVDGRFYLLDGPPGAKRWYRDDNAANSRGSDVFSIDPRSLVAAVQPTAGFMRVGTDVIDGAAVRHLRATRLDRLPALNLSLGPIEPASVRTLDVWADDSGVVRRLDVTASSTETRPAGTLKKVQRPDGTYTVEFEPAPGTVTTEHRAAYSVRFYDIGAPIAIAAPADATPVRAQG